MSTAMAIFFCLVHMAAGLTVLAWQPESDNPCTPEQAVQGCQAEGGGPPAGVQGAAAQEERAGLLNFLASIPGVGETLSGAAAVFQLGATLITFNYPIFTSGGGPLLDWIFGGLRTILGVVQSIVILKLIGTFFGRR